MLSAKKLACQRFPLCSPREPKLDVKLGEPDVHLKFSDEDGR